MMNVVVMGGGKAGENLVRELTSTARTRVLAVCDIEPLMAEQLAVRYGIPRHYSDAERMLSIERPAVAYVATPPQSHLALATLALDAGCHVYVEKPLALSHREAERLINHALCRQRKLTIGYGYHFEPISRTMRSLIADGVLGDPVHVESFMGYALDGQFGKPVFADSNHWVHELPGRIVHNVIDHLLYKVTEFIPDEGPLVFAHSGQRAHRTNPAFDLPDEVRLVIAGRDVTAYATFSAHARPLSHSLVVYGTRNTMHLDFLAGTLTLGSSSTLPGAMGRLARAFDQSWQHFQAGAQNVLRFARSDFHVMSGLRHLIEAFHASIRNDTSPPVAYPEILRISRIVDQVFLQLDPPQRRHA